MCDTWSLILRQEHRLRVFENGVLRRIFGPKRDEVTGDWRKLHNKELHNFDSSPNIIRMIKSSKMIWTVYVACMGEKMNAFRVLVGKLEAKRPLGRPRLLIPEEMGRGPQKDPPTKSGTAPGKSRRE
jgi:hypothetical protein